MCLIRTTGGGRRYHKYTFDNVRLKHSGEFGDNDAITKRVTQVDDVSQLLTNADFYPSDGIRISCICER
jgi:hypothetical protein